MINEAGNEFLHHLLKAAIALVNNIPYDYRDIVRMHSSNPELFKQWKVAMDDEFKSLQKRDIWDLVDLPKGRNLVRCCWVFDLKTDGCKKARVIAKGFSQRPRLDYDETFLPSV